MHAATKPLATPTLVSHRRLEQARPRVQAAIAALQAGDIVLVAEDARGPGAVFAIAAAGATTVPIINAMVAAPGAIIASTVGQARARELGIEQLPRKRVAESTPRYCVSVEAAEGVSTGISASDRALTAKLLGDPGVRAEDFVRPGHVMPIEVCPFGVFRRPYGPEAAHDLIALAGLDGGATLCHVLDGVDDLQTASAPALAQARGWPLVHVSDVIAWRSAHDAPVRLVSRDRLQTATGGFVVSVHHAVLDDRVHLVLETDGAAAQADSDVAPLVRLHSSSTPDDVLAGLRSDTGEQLSLALQAIGAAGHGALLYLNQEGRGAGLSALARAWALQDARGVDTVEANIALGFEPDGRDYAVAGQILRDLGMTRVRLLTNNPDKVRALQEMGIEVVERVPLVARPEPSREPYLEAKRARLGHLL